DDADLGGCDISHTGVREASRRMPGGMFLDREFPVINRKIDIAITSEVIEHTAEYRKVLEWLAENLKANGELIITTPGGTLDPPDRYYGHIQHFTLEQLTSILRGLGFRIIVARDWGFPFFTLQKWVTDRNFDRLRERYMHGDLDFRKKAIFTLTYYAYYAHDMVSKGPQIFIHARKESTVLPAQSF
ncbi:MAG: methyltransferase domain-containing protein, partial [Thermoanaerobaculia bacterium]